MQQVLVLTGLKNRENLDDQLLRQVGRIRGAITISRKNPFAKKYTVYMVRRPGGESGELLRFLS
jgi:GGDEF domain-containing protein